MGLTMTTQRRQVAEGGVTTTKAGMEQVRSAPLQSQSVLSLGLIVVVQDGRPTIRSGRSAK